MQALTVMQTFEIDRIIRHINYDGGQGIPITGEDVPMTDAGIIDFCRKHNVEVRVTKDVLRNEVIIKMTRKATICAVIKPFSRFAITTNMLRTMLDDLDRVTGQTAPEQKK